MIGLCGCSDTLAPYFLSLKVEAYRWQKLATLLELATLWQPRASFYKTKSAISF